MAWVRVDDCFADHPKVIAAGPMASWLYICGLTYCARLLTDGFIPTGQVRKLADLDNAAGLAEKLVDVGLWERVDGGFKVHDFLEYNPTADKVKADRKAAQERMQKHRSGEVRANNSRSSEEVQQPHAHPTPTPVPTPLPAEENTGDAPAAPAREGYPAVYESFWREYPKGHGSKAAAFTVWKRIPATEREAVMDGLVAWKQCGRWQRDIIVNADRWLREKRWRDDPPEDSGPNGVYRSKPYDDPQPTPDELEAREQRRQAALARDGETAEERWARLHPEQAAGLRILKS